MKEDEIIKRIESIINNKVAPLLAGGLAIIKDNKTLYIDSLAIKKEYRGLNIGKEILTKVLNSSKERFSEVFLVAYKESANFYKKLNFSNMNEKDPEQHFAIKKLVKERIDYPQYADFMQKSLNNNETDKWYCRIKKINI